MSYAEQIARLGTDCGVHRDYWDIWGNRHPMTEATERALLAAMGFDVGDEASVRAAADGRVRGEWSEPLPPVLVRREDAVLAVPVALGLHLDEATLEWTVTHESGHVERGRTPVRELPVEATGAVDEQIFRRHTLSIVAPPAGYHRLSIRVDATDGVSADVPLVVAPGGCFDPCEERAFGVMLPLYALRSASNWGIGDLSDLAAAIRILAAHGADFVGINPLHMLYPGEPWRASPYSPSSRRFLNPLYLDVELIAGAEGADDARTEIASASFQAELAALRRSDLIDYRAVAARKLAMLERLHASFQRNHLERNTGHGAAFREFAANAGEPLRRMALFESLREIEIARVGDTRGTPIGPLAPIDDDTFETLTRVHRDRIGFHQYLQWHAASQLGRCAALARERGMRIGLYGDLAVGVDAGGADVWTDPEVHARGVSFGAPPDDFAPRGQAWGLAPMIPQRLRERGYDAFIACLRANMHHAGALRIDHVVGLLRQYWVPDASPASEGGYIACVLDDLLGIVALESHRNRCMVVGEDLGTIPDELRLANAANHVLSYRVLYFERRWDGDLAFCRAEEFPELSLVTITTHDLATFAGYCLGRDIETRATLADTPPEEIRQQIESRRSDLAALTRVLREEDLIASTGSDIEYGVTPPQETLVAAHTHLARSPARLMAIQIEDLLGEVDQINLPGTIDEYPNWRRKIPVPIEAWGDHRTLCAVLAKVSRERGGATGST